ncbi:hypothetical protein ACJZ2D_008047 [Fusarium nematophilum]
MDVTSVATTEDASGAMYAGMARQTLGIPVEWLMASDFPIRSFLFLSLACLPTATPASYPTAMAEAENPSFGNATAWE